MHVYFTSDTGDAKEICVALAEKFEAFGVIFLLTY